MKVLIIRIDHIGDLILTTPLIRSIARSGHYVDAIVRASAIPVLQENPFVVNRFMLEEIVPLFPNRWLLLAKWIRSRAYDAIILPHAKPKELLFASFFSGVRYRVAMWSGFWGRLTFHHCLRSDIKEGNRHFSDIILDCARTLHIPTDGLKLDFFLMEREQRVAREEMNVRFPGLSIVGIHPGCAGNTCNLPSSVYGKLALRLLEMKNIAVVGTGIANEMDLFKTWPDAVLNNARFYNACGKWSLQEFAARMTTFSMMVVAGTSPLHIANALELPTISPFCATPAISSTVWGNLTPGSQALSPPKEYCEKRRRHSYSHCAFNGHISIDDMYKAVMKFMEI